MCPKRMDLPENGAGEPQTPWTPWTPWSECSASCGPGHQRRYRFCAPQPAAPCSEPQSQERPCVLQPCAWPGGWSPWSPWSSCSRSCGAGVRSRSRACSSPAPQGWGDFCEGPPVQLEPCGTQECPAPDCAAVPGSVFSPCGPPCPRSCDDIS
ncbi:SCO-spondin-like, partial [Oxyura jamaicensis]|uniref:SCO-spondin-like n=1 Tax=Oxyura jamaicensis TaxID=8884 RepID=UPI0015A5929C